MTRRNNNHLRSIAEFPVPNLISLYAVAVLSSMSAMEIAGWGASAFTVVFIFANHFLKIKEFKLFRIGVELPLFGLIVIVILGLLINANGQDMLENVGHLRWILMLYCLTYALDLFPSLNRVVNIWLVGGTIAAGYAIFQHFACVDLVRGNALQVAPGGTEYCQVVGFLSHHLTYGNSMAMIMCFAFAAFLLGKRKSLIHRGAFLLATAAIGLSILWTYGRGVWIAIALASVIMSAYVSKKHLFSFLIIGALIFGIGYTSNPELKERFNSIWSDTNFSNVDRQGLWKANFEMFKDYPWLGVGYGQNLPRLQEYYEKVNIKREWGGHAHNNYLQMLSTTGLLGFACYMFFILSFLLLTHRLWLDIPETHFWHRVIVLGGLGAQISMHTGGITQWNFGDAEVNHLFIFILAMMALLADRYARGIVPDDYAL